MKKNKKLLLSWLLFLLLSASCAQNTVIETTDSYSIDNNIIVLYSTPTIEPFDFPTSETNLTTIKGRLIVLNLSMLPAKDDAIFLVPLDPINEISTIPSFEMGDVPQAIVDERTGDFVFTNIEIGKYALIVMTQNGAQIPASFKENSSYVIFDVNENNLGEIIDLKEVNFP